MLPIGVAILCAASPPPSRGTDLGCSATCPAPVLAPPEPALRRAVHLTWTDPHRALARRYEIARRRDPSEPWASIAEIPSNRPDHHDDTGTVGEGLDPGAYEYRVRGRHRARSREAWSEWSPAQRVEVRSACADAGGELGGLPRVVASDLDGDGRHTGADLERALRACARLGGCVLEALPVTYDDVAVVISNGEPAACDVSRTACLTDRFPNGLAIEGHGPSTVLRSPLWRSPYQPDPVLEIWRRPDLRLQLRHLVLDGRKTEQRDPLPGQNNAVGWRHFGIHVGNYYGNHERNRDGCIHDVVLREFMTRGVSLSDVLRWSIEHSAVEGIGCARSLTPCPRLSVPDAYGPGYTSTGVGINIDWFSDDVVVRANRVRRVAKCAISLKHRQDASEASIRRPRVEENDIDEAGQLGIFVGGVADGLIQNNRIAATDSLNPQPEARAYNDTFGVSCNGALERTRFLRNRIEDMYGMAFMWNCYGRENVVADTRISGSCRRKGPQSCAPGSKRDCYLQPDIWVVDGSAGSLVLADNEVSDSGCAAPLSVDLTQRDLDVRIQGGRYAAGRSAVKPVQFLEADVLVDGGASFTGTSLVFGRGSRGVVAPDVSVEGSDERYRMDRKADVLVCPEHERKCEKMCSGAEPPVWCTAPGRSRRQPRRRARRR